MMRTTLTAIVVLLSGALACSASETGSQGAAGTAGSSVANAGTSGSAGANQGGAGSAGMASGGSSAGSPAMGGAGSGGQGGSAGQGGAGGQSAGAGGSDQMGGAGGAAGAAGAGGSGGMPMGLPDGPSSERQTARPIGSTEAPTGFWEYLPPGYGDGTLRPLLVFFHGVGENGNGDDELDLVLGHGPPMLIDDDNWPSERPFVVLSSQHSGDGCPSAQEIDDFYTFAIANYDVDPTRIYLTGLSCGANGSWNYLAEFADKVVAAAVLIAGGAGDNAWETAGCAMGTVAIWAFHGGDDGPEGSTVPIEGLQACPGAKEAKVTVYPGVGHVDSWVITYDLSEGHDPYAWLLTHTK